MNFVVPEDHDGDRLDLIVARLGGISRSAAKALILDGGVVCGGVVITTPRFTPSVGDDLSFEPLPPHPPLEPHPVDFDVLFEDEHIAIVVKPAGVVTHPGAGDTGVTLAAGVLHRWPEVRGVGSEARWGIVHRLDRDTSGLLLIGLTHDSHAALRSAIKARKVSRQYLGLVHGKPGTPAGTIEAPIGRDPRRPTRMRIDAMGRHATTHYLMEESFEEFSLLRVTLATGRTHQIRVHLASIGLPVAGDPTYGSGGGSPRLFLHATRLALTHPITGEDLVVESGLPEDLSAVLDGLRQSP